MTAVPKNPRVSELRELFRHLNAFRAVFADHGVEDITTPDGDTWSIWDLEYLFDQLGRLRDRQRQAIILCLVNNMREKDAAVAMGVKVTNPVMMYATLGLQRLLDMIDDGELRRYRETQLDLKARAQLHEISFGKLVRRVREASTRVGNNGCLVFPNASPGPPRLLLRSPRFPSGFQVVSPARILFEDMFGPVPSTTDLVHTDVVPPFSRSCIAPEHTEMQVTVGARRYVIGHEYSREKTA